MEEKAYLLQGKEYSASFSEFFTTTFSRNQPGAWEEAGGEVREQEVNFHSEKIYGYM